MLLFIEARHPKIFETLMNTEAFGARSFRGPPSRTLVCCTSESLPIVAWVVDGQTDSYHWQFRNMYPSFMRWITLKQRNSRGLTPQICTIPLPKLCQLFSHINRRVDFQGKWQKFVLTSNFAFLVNDKRSWKYFWRMQ